jgi:AcrR family transcriptional regulator
MSPNPIEKSRREENTEATRQALVSAGRDIFAKEGFQAAGMEVISRAARVTRGAFYHHFEDKKALFDAVVVAMQSDVADRVEMAARTQPRIWDRLRTGLDAYLDACLEPDYGRIVIQEAPAVLGQRRYREIEEAYPMALLIATMKALKRDGEIAFDDAELLARMIDAMICKVALMLPEAADPKKLRKNALRLIDGLLSAFRKKNDANA